MLTRAIQIEAGLRANEPDVGLPITDFESAPVSSAIALAMSRFRELQLDVLSRNGTNKELLKRIDKLQSDFKNLYRDSTDSEGRKIIDCLVYMGCIMRVSLGKRKVDYVNKLPKKRSIK